MNLHLAIDDWPFIDQFIEKTIELGLLCNNKFIVYSDNSRVINVKTKNIIFAKFDSVEFWNQIGDINKYDSVFFHSLPANAVNLINKHKINIPIYWLFWGYEAFNHPIFKDNLYLPETKRNLKKSSNFKNLIGQKLLYYKSLRTQRNWINAVRKVTFFCHYIIDDYFKLKSLINAPKLRFKYFTYGQLEKLVSINETSNKTPIKREQTILLGHSADPLLNHIDTITYLYNLKLPLTIICPLSYPNNKIYIEKVIDLGIRLFGEKFQPILKLMPPEEYNIILNGVDYAIFDSKIPIGFGNILNLLYNEKFIYFNENNSLYKTLKKMSLSVYNRKEIGILDNSHSINKNKAILVENFGTEITSHRFNSLLNLNVE